MVEANAQFPAASQQYLNCHVYPNGIPGEGTLRMQLTTNGAAQDTVTWHATIDAVSSLDDAQAAGIQAFPVPCVGQLQLEGIPAGATIVLQDQAGAVVRQLRATGTQRAVIDKLTPGAYVLTTTLDGQIDLEDALTWLEGQQGRKGWPSSWVAAGSSAGAETALWSGYVHAPDRWAGVLSFSGALDASTLPLSTAPPLLAVHGQCDALVPFGANLHHFCPKDSPGAWALIGGPAWADSLRRAAVPASTWVQCGGSHRVCTSAMSNPAVVDRVIQWLRKGGNEEWDVLVDAAGHPLQAGRSSCPQPCN